jgi:hypothetical protein
VDILAHRGYWGSNIEKNSLPSFKKALERGYGIETDIRDSDGGLVISHNIPTGNENNLEELLYHYKSNDCNSMLALNIKSDGLSENLELLIKKYGIENYFIFDMSIPDTIPYFKKNINVYTRHSDIETTPLLYEQSSGIWLDMFFEDWVTEDVINNHIKLGKRICLVSPELHGRKYYDFWNKLKVMNLACEIMICTDYPNKAERFFNEQN